MTEEDFMIDLSDERSFSDVGDLNDHNADFEEPTFISQDPTS